MKEPKWLVDLDTRCSLETKRLLAHIRELREALSNVIYRQPTATEGQEIAALLTREEPPEVE